MSKVIPISSEDRKSVKTKVQESKQVWKEGRAQRLAFPHVYNFTILKFFLV